MQIVMICELMGWTYYQYMEQPAWFIKLIKMKISLDGDVMRKSFKKPK